MDLEARAKLIDFINVPQSHLPSFHRQYLGIDRRFSPMYRCSNRPRFDSTN